jgi:hypothetical protein
MWAPKQALLIQNGTLTQTTIFPNASDNNPVEVKAQRYTEESAERGESVPIGRNKIYHLTEKADQLKGGEVQAENVKEGLVTR